MGRRVGAGPRSDGYTGRQPSWRWPWSCSWPGRCARCHPWSLFGLFRPRWSGGGRSRARADIREGGIDAATGSGVMSLTLCVLLWARPGAADALAAYEDQVLNLVPKHGGQVLQRARSNGEPGSRWRSSSWNSHRRRRSMSTWPTDGGPHWRTCATARLPGRRSSTSTWSLRSPGRPGPRLRGARATMPPRRSGRTRAAGHSAHRSAPRRSPRRTARARRGLAWYR